MTAKKMAEDFMSSSSYNNDGSKCLQFSKTIPLGFEKKMVEEVEAHWGKSDTFMYAKRYYRWCPNGR